MLAFATSRKTRFEWLTSFLKRRWILLSCALVVLAGACIDASWVSADRHTLVGVRAGRLWYDHHSYYVRYPQPEFYEVKLHRPFEELPGYDAGRTGSISLWLPLSVILGWIVWRELRWREKRE